MKLKWIPGYQLTLAVGVVILYLTLLPKPFGEEDIPLFPGADKLAHACMFGGLVLTYIFDRFRCSGIVKLRTAIYAAILASVYGILIEILQLNMEMGRSGDVRDIVADIFGAFAAVPATIMLHWVNITVKHRSK